jgi:hypothetical protein
MNNRTSNTAAFVSTSGNFAGWPFEGFEGMDGEDPSSL